MSAFPTPPAAHLIGGGTLPAPMIAELIRNGAKIQPVRHPGDAPPEPGYRPSAALERFIRCRDMTCRFPGCDHPAEFADIDHTIPYPLRPHACLQPQVLMPKTPPAEDFLARMARRTITRWHHRVDLTERAQVRHPSGQSAVVSGPVPAHRRISHCPKHIPAPRGSGGDDAQTPPYPRTRPRPPHRRRTRPQRRPRHRTQPTTALLVVPQTVTRRQRRPATRRAHP